MASDNTPKNDKLRKFDKSIRKQFHAQPQEKKEKSLNAKTFILYPFELKLNQDKSFEEKESETLELIIAHLKIYKKCFVATSFGMDSIVLMDLVIRCAKKINADIPDMFLNDTLNTFKEEKAYWKKMIEYFGIEKQIKIFTPPADKHGKQQTVWTVVKKVGHLPDFRRRHDQRKNGKRGHTPQCCDILKKASMKHYMKDLEDKYDCHFIGTRAEESRMRSMSVLQRCRTYLITSIFPHPIRAVTPLSYWKRSDIDEYYKRYNIPINPAYEIHQMNRMGCASCPAHKNWEIRLATDPTNDGFGMLEMNFKLLADSVHAGTDYPERLVESMLVLKKFLAKKESHEKLTDKMRERIELLLDNYSEEFEKLGAVFED